MRVFHGGELVIVIESDDMLESGSMHASAGYAKVEQCLDPFMTLVGLCEALNEPAR